MKRSILHVLACTSTVGCALAPTAEERTPPTEPVAQVAEPMFFANSTRRDPTPEEASRTAFMVSSGCTAFFLENTQGRTYVATARHCTNFAITSWCSQDGRIRDSANHLGTCKRIVAGDPTHDIAIFEADLAHPSSGDATLRVATFVPRVNTPLVMIGFPVDDDPATARHGRLTTTEDCWILSGAGPSPHVDYDTRLSDTSVRHNCTTYGGNSGGPMVIEGTRDAVGLPFTYAPNDYTRRDANDLATASHMALLSDLAAAHRAELDAAGIVVTEVQP